MSETPVGQDHSGRQSALDVLQRQADQLRDEADRLEALIRYMLISELETGTETELALWDLAMRQRR